MAEFARTVRNIDGLQSYCRACKSLYDRNYRLINKERRAANAKNYNLIHRKKIAAYSRQRKYGVSPEKYDKLFMQQSGVCAICHQPEVTEGIRRGVTRVAKSMAVDHDHESGNVRGLLCRLCNTSLGGFRDNIGILESAIRYLQNPYRIYEDKT